MRAATASGPQSLEVSDLESREPGPGEVRVRVRACGLCGSDLHAFHAGMTTGLVPGHEIAGSVDLLGAEVDGLQEGGLVAVEPIANCGTCPACRTGQSMWCRSAQLYGVHRPGGMAEEIVVPASRVFPVDPALDPAIAALVEPVAVAVHALRRVALEHDERVLVLGAGTIGLVSILAARALGARDVWITARHPHQADIAMKLGASRVLAADDADVHALERLGREHDVDVVVETVGGTAPTLNLAAAALRPGGRVSVLGLFAGTQSINPWPLLSKELSLVWSSCYARPSGERPDFEVAARLVEDERECLSALCTHAFSLDEVQTAFEVASDKRSGSVKVSLLP